MRQLRRQYSRYGTYNTTKSTGQDAIITINVTVIYIARDVVILMPATSITRAIGRGWALKIETFVGP